MIVETTVDEQEETVTTVEQSGFKNKKGKDLEHKDLYQQVVRIYSEYNITAYKVSGHKPNKEKKTSVDKIFSHVNDVGYILASFEDMMYEIYEEYADQGIHVMAVCPGYTKTNFNKRAKISSKSVPGYIMTSEDVVEESLKAFKNKKHIIINGKINRFAKWFISILPTKIAMKLSKNIIKKGMDNKRW